ncbi:hypothetical protein ONA92_02080 [Mycobacteroides salmoniphilum]|uniref:hypothetical protein n=1 Tax=Mycobacteroides salmoniphilum TaxID=404941 RepID=UPI003565F84E
MNLPPEVMDKLGPHQSTWFTQPIATVIAATIALLAAAIAYHGLRSQLGATAKEAQRDRRAAAIRSRNDRQAAAELARGARQAEHALARNIEQQKVVDALINLVHAIHQDALEGGADPTKDAALKRKFDTSVVEAYVLRERMLIVGLEDGARVLVKFLRVASDHFGTGEPSTEVTFERRRELLESLRQDLNRIAADSLD